MSSRATTALRTFQFFMTPPVIPASSRDPPVLVTTVEGEGGCRVKPGMTVLAARLRAACNDTGAAGDAKVDKPDNTSVLNPLLARAPNQVTKRCENRRRVIADLKA
jgi:hypothetical protein